MVEKQTKAGLLQESSVITRSKKVADTFSGGSPV